MGVCSPYETLVRAMKDLPVEDAVSSSPILLGDSAPILPDGSINGNPISHSNEEASNENHFTNSASVSKSKPQTSLNDAQRKSVDTNNSSTLTSDETAALNQQLGVPSTTNQPEVTQPYSKRPRWRVTQSTGSQLNMRPTTELPKSVGYGLLVPPKRSTPNIYDNKGSHAIFRVNDQRRKLATPVPLPPLPPALTNPTLPPNASPQERLQYAMIMHNHSRLNQGEG